MVAALILSFRALDTSAFGSLEGYRALLAGGLPGEILQILLRSLIVTGLAMSIAAPAGFALAQAAPRTRSVIVAALITCWLTSDMLRAFGWQLLLAPDGAMSTALTILTGTTTIELRYNHLAAIVGLVSATMPAAVISMLVGLPERTSTEWLAAREIAGPGSVFILMFGRAKLGFILGCAIVFVLSAFSAAEARYLDGPTQTSVQTIAASLSNVGVSALLAFGVVLLGFVLICYSAAGLVYVTATHMTPSSSVHRIRHRLLRSRSDHWREIADWIVRRMSPTMVAVALVLSTAPLFPIIVEAFQKSTRSGPVWTLNNFVLMANSPDLAAGLINSIVIAMAVALVAAVSGFILSLAVWSRWHAGAVLLLMGALAFIPGEIYSLSLVQVLRLGQMAEGGRTLVIVAQALWAVPFATATLMLANRQLGENVLRAGQELLSPASVITRIVGGANRWTIVGVLLLSSTLSLNENTRATYLSGSLPTLSNELFGRLTAGLLPENHGMFALEFVLVASAAVGVLSVLAALQVGNSVGAHQSRASETRTSTSSTLLSSG
jgi:ABC-type spermidine/putrescine transport system permease subunit II